MVQLREGMRCVFKHSLSELSNNADYNCNNRNCITFNHTHITWYADKDTHANANKQIKWENTSNQHKTIRLWIELTQPIDWFSSVQFSSLIQFNLSLGNAANEIPIHTHS